MTLRYQSCEEIKKGDRVLFQGEPAEVEFVVDRLTGEGGLDWYMQEFGGGVMIREPKHFGSAFIPANLCRRRRLSSFCREPATRMFNPNLLDEKKAKDFLFMID
jgi:hypothetical protein